MANVLSFIRGKTYTLFNHNKVFGEHTPIIAETSIGKTYDNIVSTGVSYYYKELDGTDYTGDVNYDSSGDIYSGTTYTTDSVALNINKIEFTPTSAHADILYIVSGKDLDMAIDLYVVDAVGSILNAEQFFYMLGIRRSNRLYDLPYYAKYLTSYMEQVVPAGADSRLINMPPTASGVGSNIWYTGGTSATLSGVATDPEDDILSYVWTQSSPTTDTVGTDLLSTIADDTLLGTTAALTTPPVDRIYDFNLEVEDSDNKISTQVQILVSGTYRFDSWGDTEFNIGDAELPYEYLS